MHRGHNKRWQHHRERDACVAMPLTDNEMRAGLPPLINYELVPPPPISSPDLVRKCRDVLEVWQQDAISN